MRLKGNLYLEDLSRPSYELVEGEVYTGSEEYMTVGYLVKSDLQSEDILREIKVALSDQVGNLSVDIKPVVGQEDYFEDVTVFKA